jgi:general secretion pathway protein G
VIVQKCQVAGFTLIELVVSATIVMTLCSMAIPIARYEARREKEQMLRNDLQQLRDAIDRYAEGSLAGKFNNAPSYGYPPDLQALVNPIELRNGAKLRILKEIPIDPMTGARDWGVHSMEDDPDSDSWDGNQIWDVYSKATGTGLNGMKYRNW